MFGPLVSCAFLIAILWYKGGRFHKFVVYLNVCYFVACMGAVTADFTIRYADPDRYCLETSDTEGLNTCDSVWNQLARVWIIFVVIAPVWLWALKRMTIFVF